MDRANLLDQPDVVGRTPGTLSSSVDPGVEP